MKRIISFDCDGVLLDFTAGIMQWADEEWPGLQLTHANFHQWDTPGALGLDPATESRMWSRAFELSLRPIPAAETLVDTLRARGYHIIVVSARDAEGQDMAAEDLGYYFRILRSDVHFTQDKNRALTDLGALAHLDDKWKSAESIGRMWEGEGKISYLVDRPWNRSLDLTARYKRLYSYLDVLNDFE